MAISTNKVRSVDEETPLLRDQVTRPKETPLPVVQFSLVLFLQLAEPLTSQVIYPFVPKLIREIGITHGDDTKVGYYVGLMQSIFFATQALTVLHWSRASDRVGRKPVLLVGLAGLALSMYAFGLARAFPALVAARCLNGALNGNIGVIKSMMGELTDSTNVARAFAYQPIAWSTGATIGPLIGGALAHPTERFPNLFGGNKFLEKYPYFLPCSIPATFSIICWLVTYLFLKETNPTGFTLKSFFSHSRKDTVTTVTSPAPPLRSLLTKPVLLSTAAYALLSLLDIAYRALQPVFYANPRSLGGLGLPPHAIGSALAVLGFTNGVFQVLCFARLVHSWGVKRVYLVGIASAAPIFALFPLMSAVVRAEDNAVSSAPNGTGTPISGDEFHLSWTLIILLTLQLALTLLLNMCYGSVFIYITAAAGVIPSVKPVHSTSVTSRPAISSSSSSSTLVPSTFSHKGKGKETAEYIATPSSSSSSRQASSIRKEITTPQPKDKNVNKTKSKKMLGAVNGLAQCTVSIMRCLGPYTASSLFAQGLAWEYGRTAPPVDEIPDPLPDGILSGQPSLFSEYLSPLNGDIVMKRVGGCLVYAVLIAITWVTLVVGDRLPEVPWEATEEDENSSDENMSSNSEEDQGQL